MRILAIDPGNVESGYAVINMPDFELLDFGKVNNNKLLDMIRDLEFGGWKKSNTYFKINHFAIEMIGNYGMPVGKDVFETCVWIGQFKEALEAQGEIVNYIYRKDEKMTLCENMKAKDSNIRQALINRYAKHNFKNGKGTQKNPDTFYGVANDVWQAIAVGVTYYDINYLNKER